ncbi:PepSY-associated TM helix domain-containing protein, partial [Delftia sp. ZNC0008]
APGTSRAVVELREGGGMSLINRGQSETLRFDGVTGQLQASPEAPAISWVRATGNVITGVHLGRFAEPATRWLLLLSGVVGTFMAASGMVLWVVKRMPERRKLGRTPFGHRLVEVLNVGSIAGLSVAVAGFFWLNRLLPVPMQARSDWEINGFFIIWLLCLLHPLRVSHRNAWLQQMALAAVLYALLPLLNLLTGGASLVQTLANGQWSIASFDLLMLGLAAIHGVVAWWLLRGKPAVAAAPAAPRTQARAASHAPTLERAS